MILRPISVLLITALLAACAPGTPVPTWGDEDSPATAKTAVRKPPRGPGVYHDIVIRPDGRPSVVITVIRPRPLPEPPVKGSLSGSNP